MPSITQPIHRGNLGQEERLICLLSNLTISANNQTITGFTAQLDTGASKTQLGQGIVNTFGLRPIPRHPTNPETVTIANGIIPVDNYEGVTISLPNNLGIFTITAQCIGTYFQMGLNAPYHLIIGLDILTEGTFLIDGLMNPNEKTFTLTFPDQHE